MDYDGDGIQDFISGSYDPGDLYLFRGLGQGRYAAVEKLLDENGTPLVHHPEQLVQYERLRKELGEDGEGVVQARVASFGSWPAAVDWDADGDLDILIGSFSGGLFLRENVGTRTAPKYSAMSVPVRAGDAELRVNGHANPVVADWDGDGLWDLVVGASDGSVVWHRNVGSAGTPSFGASAVLVEAKSSNKFLAQFLRDDEAPRPGVRAQICVVDHDGDGALDLIVGDYSDVLRPRPDLTETERAELERGLVQLAAAATEKERADASKPLRPLMQESVRHSAVWLYRRVASDAAVTAPVEASAQRSGASDGSGVDVPVPAPTDTKPVALGIGLSSSAPRAGEVLEVVVRLRTAEGWHVHDVDASSQYTNTELELVLPAGLEPVGAWRRPPSAPYQSGGRIFEGDVRFVHAVRVVAVPEAGAEVVCDVGYQVCNLDLCHPPATVQVSAVIAGGEEDGAADSWAPHRKTRVLYAGSADGHRERVFAAFLAEHFDSSATIPLEKLSMETARDFDVVIVDWKSQYGCDGYEQRENSLFSAPVNLGPEFTKPFIALTYVGTQVRDEYKLDWL